MKILVDAMGGDNAPLCVLQGVSQAAAEFGDGMELVLLGEEKAIRDCAKENKIDLAPFEILNCTETIDMHDDPVNGRASYKKDSSLVKGLTMTEERRGRCLCQCRLHRCAARRHQSHRAHGQGCQAPGAGHPDARR